MMLCHDYGFHLSQEHYWWIPAKLPTPAEWSMFGVFVFAQSGILAGLDLWSVDGLESVVDLPNVEQLRPLIARPIG